MTNSLLKLVAPGTSMVLLFGREMEIQNSQKCKIDNAVAVAPYQQKCSHIWLSILLANYTTCYSIM